MDGGLVKGYPWRIWEIIDTLTLHVTKGDLVGPGGWSVMMILKQNRSIWTGISYNQQSRVGGGPGYGYHPRPGPSRETLPVPESAVPNNGVQVICPHFRCFGSPFDVIFLALLAAELLECRLAHQRQLFGRKGQSRKRFSNPFLFFSMKLLWDDINNILQKQN